MQTAFLPRRTWALAGLALVGLLVVLAYRALPQRSFAADDFQWLIGARTLGLAEMLRSAFDPNQNHFYRPLVWVLFWLQARLFGLNATGYHATSLLLHGVNVLLLARWIWLLAAQRGANPRAPEPQNREAQNVKMAHSNGPKQHDSGSPNTSSAVVPSLLAAGFFALHPAPFEAVAWVSAQSELLATCWLLLALVLWVGAGPGTGAHPLRYGLALLALACALATKESTVVGLPLLVLCDLWALAGLPHGERPSLRFWLGRYALPALLLVGYAAIQLRVERENYVVDQGAYGLGPQLVLNPLRSIGLAVLPLPGSEHANAAWLVPAGALVALVLGVFALVRGLRARGMARLDGALVLAALVLVLLPTAPFVSPPDSRYLYLPVMMMALALAALAGWALAGTSRRWLAPALAVAGLLVALLFAGESAAREQRFAQATGTDGSLMALAVDVCAARIPDRVILLNAPLAEQHARALLDLACGSEITPIFVDTREIADANMEDNSLIIDFPGGSAHIAASTQ